MTQNKHRRSRGRLCKLTPEIQQKVVAALRAGNYAHVAAEYAGIDRATFYRWMQRGRESTRGKFSDFCEAVKNAEREAEVRAVAVIQNHMADNWQAAMTYLERKYPDRWGRRDRVSLEVNPQRALAVLLDTPVQEIEEVVSERALLADGKD